jgi:hypothetical protein
VGARRSNTVRKTPVFGWNVPPRICPFGEVGVCGVGLSNTDRASGPGPREVRIGPDGAEAVGLVAVGLVLSMVCWW